MATTTTHRAHIDGMTVKSKCDYIVYGSVRGLVSEHRTLSGAEKSLTRDRNGCASLGGGAYSDASIYQWDDEAGWVATDGNDDSEY